MKRIVSLSLVASMLAAASPARAVQAVVAARGGAPVVAPAVAAPSPNATAFSGVTMDVNYAQQDPTLPPSAVTLSADPGAGAWQMILPGAAAYPAESSAAQSIDDSLSKEKMAAEILRRINPSTFNAPPPADDFDGKGGARIRLQSKLSDSAAADQDRNSSYARLLWLAGDAYRRGRAAMDGGKALPAGDEADYPEAPSDGRHPLLKHAPDGSTKAEPAEVPAAAPEERPELLPWITFQVARAVLYLPLKLLYRVRYAGVENLPSGGPYLLISNHPSYLDVIFLGFVIGRPIRYLMYRKFYEIPGLRWLFHAFGAIPVAAGEGKDKREAALEAAYAALKRGEIVAVFPEGSVTRTGNLAKFKHGFETIAKATGVPVVPAHLDGLWGSLTSFRKVWTRPWMRRRIVQVRIGAPLAKADIQTARETIEFLAAESMTERLHLTSDTLPREFLRRAKRYWSKTAVADSTGRELTFGRLLTAGVLLAQLLRPAQSTPHRPNVGILLPPSAGGVIANLAVGILGKTAVNLNYTASEKAYQHALEDAEIEVIVSSRRFVEKFEQKTGRGFASDKLVYLEDLLPKVSKRRMTLTYLLMRLLPVWLIERIWFGDAHRALTSLAAIIYTSGSTGRPKGVMLSHRNIQANVQMLYRLYSTSDGMMLGVLPFFHSFGYTVTLWMSLLRGVGAAYHNHPLESDPISELGRRYKAAMLLGTPTFLSRYAAEVPEAAFAYLTTVIAGAEKMPSRTADAFGAKFKVKPREGYGMSELSPVVTVNVPDAGAEPHVHVGTKEGTVGQPLPGIAVRVVDPETGASVPDGEIGILMVYGPNVMRGYLNRPEDTRAVLTSGWMRTGDMARIDREGFVEILGRESRFSKIFGEGVSHIEVEEALHEAAGLSGGQVFVVTAVPDPDMGERLVVLYAGFEGEVSDVLRTLRERNFPRLRTPAASMFFRVPAIPLLGSGKLDLAEVKRLGAELAGGK